MSIREKFEDSIYDALRKWYQKRKRWQKTAIKWFISLAVVGYLFVSYALPPIREWWANRYSPFPKDVAGILVLRIEGDDADNDLQRRLVSELNTSVRQEAVGQKIEVRGQNELVSESMGWSQAHAKAREIGKACKAILVIWGNRVDDNTFYPRLTVVESKSSSFTSGQWALAAQDIKELKFPSARVDQPVYLKHFVTGYAFYDRENYAAALTQFKAALNQSVVNPVELNEIRMYCGNSHYYLAQGQRDMGSQLQQAIAYYDTALSFYTEKDFPEQWARIQNNLGSAYLNLPTSDRSENLQKAIAFFEAAMRVYTEKDFPANWANIQNGLGVVYFQLSTGDRSKNLQKAITFYEAALRVHTEKDYPVEWASAQHNLGINYSNLPTGDRSENLQKAIAFYEAALRVRTEKTFPIDWARIQYSLGRTYSDLPTGDLRVNLQKAIAFHEAALRVRTEKDFPVDWADTQNDLGDAYADSIMSDRSENRQKAIACYEAALSVYTEKDFPEDWARTQRNLGDVYAQALVNPNAYAGILSGLLMGTRSDTSLNTNLQKAVVAYEAALRVYTEKDFPEKWAEIQNIRGVAYMFLPTGDRNANLQKAIAACEAALRVYTEKDAPKNWAGTQFILSMAYLFSSVNGSTTNVNKAIAACEAALRVYTEKDSVFWAGTQYMLGSSLALSSGESNAKLQKSLAAFEAALQVFTERNHPFQWAMTQFLLGGVYSETSTGSRSQNLQRAIAYFENALKVFTAEAYPELHEAAIEGIKEVRNKKAVEEKIIALQEEVKALEEKMKRYKQSKP